MDRQTLTRGQDIRDDSQEIANERNQRPQLGDRMHSRKNIQVGDEPQIVEQLRRRR